MAEEKVEELPSPPEEPKKKKEDPGAPAWMTTFADLMSLLMTFFILLLSFSKMEVPKFKIVAGSLREAFGYRKDTEFDMPPAADSLIKEEQSPGEPKILTIHKTEDVSLIDEVVADLKKKKEEIARKEILRDAEGLRQQLKQEMVDQSVEVETEGTQLIIRIPEKASFASGSDKLRKDFSGLLVKLSEAVRRIDGQITVSGHTDNVPISTGRFRSNWELSSARAVSMAHALLKVGGVKPERLKIQGYADTRPLAPNKTERGRARNRRVEISITTVPQDGVH